MKLDKNYNFLEKRGLYEDDLVESIELITEAHSKNLISAYEANLLYKLALKKEIKKEAKSVIPSTKNSSSNVLSKYPHTVKKTPYGTAKMYTVGTIEKANSRWK